MTLVAATMRHLPIVCLVVVSFPGCGSSSAGETTSPLRILNETSDVTPIGELRSLTSLDLSRNAIVDATPLTRLTAMYDIYLMDNALTTGVERLGTMIGAQEIELTGNPDIPCVALEQLESRLGTSVVTAPTSGCAIAR